STLAFEYGPPAIGVARADCVSRRIVQRADVAQKGQPIAIADCRGWHGGAGNSVRDHTQDIRIRRDALKMAAAGNDAWNLSALRTVAREAIVPVEARAILDIGGEEMLLRGERNGSEYSQNRRRVLEGHE